MSNQSVVGSASRAASSVFGTVSTVAVQLSNTVDAAGEGIAMLNAFVTTARRKQAARIDADMETFFDSLQEDTAMENAKRQRILQEELSQDENLKKLFTENHEKLSKVIDRHRTKYSSSTEE